MAYVSAEMTKAVRVALKNKFKGFKFGVRKNAHGSTIYISILRSPVDLSGDLQEGYDHTDINHYYLDNYKNAELYREILAEVMKATASVGSEYFDDSDAQTDYFHCAYYYSLSIGDFEKPCEFVK